MKLLNQHELIVKKSKFIGFFYKIDEIYEVEEIMNILRKEYKKAAHFPYAYKIFNLVKKSDDKEPANTAGGPILNIIEKKNLNNCLVVIIRYFGGIKLGAGGLIRAYGKCANEVTKNTD